MSRSPPRTVLAVAVAVALSLVASGAGFAAEPEPPPAEQQLAQGIDLFNRGALAEAIALLERVRPRASSPALRARVALYLGLCHAADNRGAVAREHFRQALLADPRLRLDPYQHKPELIAMLEAVRRELEAVLRVTVDLAGAEVWIDGEPRGPAPLQGRFAHGWRTVEIRAPGGELRHSRRVQLRPRETTVLELVLRRPAAATRPATGGAAQQLAARRPRGAAEPARPRSRTWTWVSAGSALAMSAAAAGLLAAAWADRDSACDLLASPPAACADRARLLRSADWERYDELHGAASAKLLASNICWAAAGSLLATAVVLYFVEGRAARAAPAAPARGLSMHLAPTAGRGFSFGLALSR